MSFSSSPAEACCSAVRVIVAAGMAVAGVAILALPTRAAQAAEPLAFTLPDDEGYGIAECMQAGNACGAAMASSWCEAHGHARVAAYGMADDVTGSVPGAATAPVSHASVIIRCGD